MSVSKSMVTPERPVEGLVYRPLSGLALASLILAGLYAAVLVVLGTASLVTRQPLPIGVPTLIVPAAAAVLALAARRQIRNSEGTRSGLALANWGWWLSVLFGLGFSAFHLATFFALRLQADRFVNEWLDLLRKGDPISINRAFLLTLPPDQREGDNPADTQRLNIRYGQAPAGKRAPLPTFREHEVIRMIRQGGPDLSITNVGVNHWEYDKTGYRFVQTYRIRGPEGEYDVRLAARNTDNRPGRPWQVLWQDPETGVPNEPVLTDFGQALQKFRRESQQFLNRWIQKRLAGDVEGMYLDTCDAGQRDGLYRAFRARRLTEHFAAIAGTVGNAGPEMLVTRIAPLYRPELVHLAGAQSRDFQQFLDGQLVRTDRLNAPAKYKDAIIRDTRAMFRPGSGIQIRMGETGAQIPPVDPNGGRFRIAHAVSFAFQLPTDPGPIPRYAGDAEVVVESDDGPITMARTPQWRIISIEPVQGGEAADRRPPAMRREMESAPAPSPPPLPK